MVQPQLMSVEPGFATGHWHDLLIGVWRGTPNLAAVGGWVHDFDTMGARFPGGYLVLSIVEARASIPDSMTRKRMSAEMDRRGTTIRRMAGVVEASGFAGAAVRSVLLALSNTTSATSERRMFSSVQEATMWIAPHLDAAQGYGGSPLEIVSAVQAFRLMIDPDRRAPPPITAGRG